MKDAAQARVVRAEAAQKVAAWGGRADIDPAAALLDLVQSKAAEVAYWEDRLSTQPDPDGLALRLLHNTQDQLASYAAAAIRAGADAAVVKWATMQATWLVPVIRRAIIQGRDNPHLQPDEVIRRLLTEQQDSRELTRVTEEPNHRRNQ